MKVLVESKRGNIEYGTNGVCTIQINYDYCGVEYICGSSYTSGPCDGARAEPWYFPKKDK